MNDLVSDSRQECQDISEPTFKVPVRTYVFWATTTDETFGRGRTKLILNPIQSKQYSLLIGRTRAGERERTKGGQEARTNRETRKLLILTHQDEEWILTPINRWMNLCFRLQNEDVPWLHAVIKL